MKRDDDMSLLTQQNLAATKNYNKNLVQFVKHRIGKRVLDVGCSIGNITSLYIKDCDKVVGIDVNRKALPLAKKRFAKSKKFTAQYGNIENPSIVNLKKKHSFDTIILFNVLEHIKYDARALQHMNKLLEKNGYLLIVTPAHQWLFGSHDRADGHYRRYSKKQLENKIKKAGFKVEQLRQINFVGIFGWYWNNIILKDDEINSSMLKLYDKVCSVPFAIERRLPIPVGLSFVAICKKK